MNSKVIVNIMTNVNGLNTPIVHRVSDRAYRQNMKQLLWASIKKIINSLKQVDKNGKQFEHTLHTRRYTMIDKHMKILRPPVIREMQAQKDILRVKSKRFITPTRAKNVEQLELSHTVGWNIKCCNHFGTWQYLLKLTYIYHMIHNNSYLPN